MGFIGKHHSPQPKLWPWTCAGCCLESHLIGYTVDGWMDGQAETETETNGQVIKTDLNTWFLTEGDHSRDLWRSSSSSIGGSKTENHHHFYWHLIKLYFKIITIIIEEFRPCSPIYLSLSLVFSWRTLTSHILQSGQGGCGQYSYLYVSGIDLCCP